MPAAKKTVFSTLFAKYYTGKPVANKRPVYPEVSTTFCAYNERNKTTGQSEHALKISLLEGVKLDENDLPTTDWTKGVKSVLVERFQPKNRQKLTGIKSSLPVPAWSRVLLMAAESLLGMDNSMARVASEVVLLSLRKQQNSRYDLIFDAKAKDVIAIEFDSTKSTQPFVLFTTIDDMLASVVRVNATAHWLDTNLKSVSKKVEKAAAQVVEVDDESAW